MSSHSNQTIPRRKLIKHPCGHCVNRCSERLSDSARDEIFLNYWQMQDYTRQSDFICAHVEQIKKQRNKTVSSRRENTYHIFFTVNGSRIKVCKAVF